MKIVDYPPRVTPPSRWVVLTLLVALVPAPIVAGDRVPFAPTRVIDGDTVWGQVAHRLVKVRVLGVDTPELGYDGAPDEPWAREARRFTATRISGAASVELEVAGDRIDGYGRALGFLWLGPPGEGPSVNLSELLLEAGLAEAIRRFDYPGKARFLGLEAEARRRGRGRWSRPPVPVERYGPIRR